VVATLNTGEAVVALAVTPTVAVAQIVQLQVMVVSVSTAVVEVAVEVADLCGLPMPKVTEVLAVRGVATLTRLVDTMAEVPLGATATNQGVVMRALTGQTILLDVVTAVAAAADAKVELLEQVAQVDFLAAVAAAAEVTTVQATLA
jgi:hypothetical protein